MWEKVLVLCTVEYPQKKALLLGVFTGCMELRMFLFMSLIALRSDIRLFLFGLKVIFSLGL